MSYPSGANIHDYTVQQVYDMLIRSGVRRGSEHVVDFFETAVAVERVGQNIIGLFHGMFDSVFHSIISRRLTDWFGDSVYESPLSMFPDNRQGDVVEYP